MSHRLRSTSLLLQLSPAQQTSMLATPPRAVPFVPILPGEAAVLQLLSWDAACCLRPSCHTAADRPLVAADDQCSPSPSSNARCHRKLPSGMIINSAAQISNSQFNLALLYQTLSAQHRLYLSASTLLPFVVPAPLNANRKPLKKGSESKGTSKEYILKIENIHGGVSKSGNSQGIRVHSIIINKVQPRNLQDGSNCDEVTRLVDCLRRLVSLARD